MAESTDFSRSRYSTENSIFGKIYGFSRTDFGYYPPPPDFRLAVKIAMTVLILFEIGSTVL